MPFKKGESGNPKGRPKDPIASVLRDGLNEVISLEKLKNSLEVLPQGAEYVQGVSRLLPFVLPKLNAIEVTSLGEIKPEDLHNMSDAELGALSKLLIEEYERRDISKTPNHKGKL